jgi:uncharacterized RDD family membrane protein YckC
MPSWANAMMDRTPVAGPAGYYYADVPNRLIAYIIDAIIVGIIGVIIAAIVGGIFGGVVNTNPLSSSFGSVNYLALLVVAVIGLIVNAGYFIYTWVAMRGTVGMRLLGIQIGNENDGRTLTYNQAGIRWVFLFGPFALAQFLNPWPALGLLIGLIAFLYLIALLVTTAQSPTKQGIHDKQAHTMVVKAARMAA